MGHHPSKVLPHLRCSFSIPESTHHASVPCDLPAACTRTLRSSAWPPRDSQWTHPTRASAPGTPAAAPRTAGTPSQESSSCKTASPAQSPAAHTPHTVWAGEKTCSVNELPACGMEVPNYWHPISPLERDACAVTTQLPAGRKRELQCIRANPSFCWLQPSLMGQWDLLHPWKSAHSADRDVQHHMH